MHRDREPRTFVSFVQLALELKREEDRGKNIGVCVYQTAQEMKDRESRREKDERRKARRPK